MSRVFYDHLILLEEIEIEIKNISQSMEEKEELWNLVDDIVNHKVIIKILDLLPLEHHEDFLSKFNDAPHHKGHIHFLNDKIEENIEEVIKKEIKELKVDLLNEIKKLKVK